MRCYVSTIAVPLFHLAVAVQFSINGQASPTDASQVKLASVGVHGEAVSVEEATKAAIAAAATVANVAAALDKQDMPASVRQAALQAASAAAARAALGGSSPDTSTGAIKEEPAPEKMMRREVTSTSGSDVEASRPAAATPVATPPSAKPQKASPQDNVVNIAAPTIESRTGASQPLPPVANHIDAVAQRPEVEVLNRWREPPPVARQMAGTWSLPMAGQPMPMQQVTSPGVAMNHGPQSVIAPARTAPAPNPEKLLYIGVFSEPRDFRKRASVRQGWMAALKREFLNGEVRAEFIIGRRPVKASAPAQEGQGASLLEVSQSQGLATANGRSWSPSELSDPWATTPAAPSMEQSSDGTPPVVDPKEVELDMALGREFAQHRDLLHIPYEDLPIRALMFFAHAADTDYRYVLKVNVDSEFLFMPIVSALREEKPETFLYAGQQLLSDAHSSVLQDGPQSPALLDESKDAMVQQLSPFLKQIKSYFAGACYLTSRTLAKLIAKNHLDHSLMLWSYNSDAHPQDGSTVDDLDVGQWVAWEDQLLAEKRAHQNSYDAHVKYRSMELCRNRTIGNAQVDLADAYASSQESRYYTLSPFATRSEAASVPEQISRESNVLTASEMPQYRPSMQSGGETAYAPAAPAYSASAFQTYSAPVAQAYPLRQEVETMYDVRQPLQDAIRPMANPYAVPQAALVRSYPEPMGYPLPPAQDVAALSQYNSVPRAPENAVWPQYPEAEARQPQGVMPHPLDSNEGYLPSPQPPSSYDLPPASEDVAAGFRG